MRRRTRKPCAAWRKFVPLRRWIAGYGRNASVLARKSAFCGTAASGSTITLATGHGRAMLSRFARSKPAYARTGSIAAGSGVRHGSGSAEDRIGQRPGCTGRSRGAKERLSEVLLRLGAEIPPQVTLTLEPTVREIDKRFLFGPVEETAAFVHQLQAAGLANLGVLLDMGHVPLMGETLESAVTHAGDTLRHIHLGNCILKNPRNPLYGDKHVAGRR